MSSQPFVVTKEPLPLHSAADCTQWLESVPLTNVAVAHAAIASQIPLTLESRLAPIELLKILETLREPVDYLQSELARKYAGKAIPLEAPEIAAWDKACGLWDRIGKAYAACREAHNAGDPALKDLGALITMRCLDSCARLMFEHYRVYREVPAATWRALHQLYAASEAAGYAQAGVSDLFGGKDPQSSCAIVYCRALLAQLASPFSLSARQIEFLARWLDKWAGLANIKTEPLPPSAIPALAVDLAGSSAPQFVERFQPGATLRYLELESLSRTLRQVMALLKQGHTPTQLGLGDDARQPGCEALLMLLYVQWCRAGTSRNESRTHAEHDKVQVCLGPHAAHFHVSGGRAFRLPGSNATPREEQDLQLFGHVSERTERMLASQESAAIESWELLNQSASGFLCMVRERDPQLRISHNQLVAVRGGASRVFAIGIVQWLRVDESGDILVGTRLLPGVPRSVTVRPANFIPGGNPGFERGLLLPEVAAPATAASLILPAGWYQMGRFVELYSDGKHVAKLVNLLERGADFDRCTVSIS